VITDTDISNALGQHLATLSPALTIGWPNKHVPAGTPHPYLIFDHVPVSRIDDTLTGGGTIVRGFAVVTVMSEINVFATSASAIADSIAALFPYTLRLAVTGGTITINNPPEVQQGYRDGPHWRVPVKIPYSAS
jgi:Bacteriophage related domain of unknown function